MPLRQAYLDYVLDQLKPLGPVQSRRMFGGAGVYLDGVIFAIIADDVLYLKVNEANRPDYEAAGMGPFQPYGDSSFVMSYYEVPAEVLEDVEQLVLWARKALAAARAKAVRGKKRGKKAD
jgi:DNA transformation protein